MQKRALLSLIVLALSTSQLPAPLQAEDPPKVNAKTTFEALKKQFPAILTKWAKDWWPDEAPELKLGRMISATEAKLVILIPYSVDGKLDVKRSALITVFAVYHQGKWTSNRSAVVPFTTKSEEYAKDSVQFLMLAIDTLDGE